MPVSSEIELEILNEFLTIFESTYGPVWPYKLTKNLKPSPIRYLSQKYNVKITYVRKLRQQLSVIGEYILLREMLLQPMSSQSVPEWLFPPSNP